jgi:hypothetical protein
MRVLWLVWLVMLCSLQPVQQAAIGNCLSFDPFSFDQNGLAPAEVDVGGAIDSNARGYSGIRVAKVEQAQPEQSSF